MSARAGVIPSDLEQRIAARVCGFEAQWRTRFIAHRLGGVAPSQLPEAKRAELVEAWGHEEATDSLQVLEEIGYGAPKTKPRRSRDCQHGARRDRRVEGIPGKLPRAFALRAPTTADTHRSGSEPNHGRDRWGTVTCSQTLRPDHVGVVAAVGGMFSKHHVAGETHVDVTGAELVQLLTGRRHPGGEDSRWVNRLLADMATVTLRADVIDKPRKDGPSPTTTAPNGYVTERPTEPSGPSDAHVIPCSPIAQVQRRVGEEWVDSADYDAARAASPDATPPPNSEPTIRVHLADWFIAELLHPTRRPTLIDFTVWSYLRPSGRRIYPFVQAHGRDDRDECIKFYLGEPTLYTMGLRGRHDRVVAIIDHAITAIWQADERYNGQRFSRYYRPNTSIIEYKLHPARRPSCATTLAKTARCPARRPSILRAGFARARSHPIVSTGNTHRDDAKAEAAVVRHIIASSSRAGIPAGAGPFDRRQPKSDTAGEDPPG